MAKKKEFVKLDADVDGFISREENVPKQQPQSIPESPKDVPAATDQGEQHQPATSAPKVTEPSVEKTDNAPKRLGRKPGQTSSTGELDTRTERVTVYFTEETMEKINLITRALDKSKNKLLTDIIETALSQEQYQKAYEIMKSIQGKI